MIQQWRWNCKVIIVIVVVVWESVDVCVYIHFVLLLSSICYWHCVLLLLLLQRYRCKYCVDIGTRMDPWTCCIKYINKGFKSQHERCSLQDGLQTKETTLLHGKVSKFNLIVVALFAQACQRWCMSTFETKHFTKHFKMDLCDACLMASICYNYSHTISKLGMCIILFEFY